MHQISVSFQLL